MNEKSLSVALAFIAGLLVSPISIAENGDHHDSQHESVEGLSPELRALLQQEMQALLSGMVSVIPAFISGNLDEVERIAHDMKDSYILKQSITQEQVHELHSSLPASFLKMDHEFHYFAGMLAHAANRQKLELVNFYLSKLTESCVGCHNQYATHKFPGFSAKGHAPKNEH